MTGLVFSEINRTGTLVESGRTSFHAWEEETQIYVEGGWVKASAPPLLQKNVPATVEIYRAGHDGHPPRLTTETASPEWAYREEAKHFLSGVLDGTPFHSSARDTLTDVPLFEEIYRKFLGL